MAIQRPSWPRSLLLYSLLLAGSAIFTLPFVYMVGTSVKTDREMAEPGLHLAPRSPRPADRSPYLDLQMFPERTDAEARRALAVVLRLLGDAGHRDAAALAPGVLHRLRQSTPDSVWTQDETTLTQTLSPRITSSLAEDVRRTITRELRVGTVRARSLDQQEAALTAPAAGPAPWQVDGTGTKLHVLGDETRVDYDWLARDRKEIRLTRTFTLPFAASRLWRLQVPISPDDSWHDLRFVVEHGGRTRVSARTQHLGGVQPVVVTLQDRGPDDAAESTKLKVWFPMDDAGPSELSNPSQVRLTLILHRSSTFDAWMLKARRNYERTFAFVPFWRYVATSLFLVTLNIIGNILSCSLTAYAFARMQWPGRNLAFGLMMATMMIPPQVTMIPYFLIIKWLGWYNSLHPLWVMSFFGNAFNIFLLRQFMKGIPRDLEDAAKIDGCNFLQIYWHVVLPLVKPTLACIAVFTFMGVWNDFMGPLLFLSDQRLYPISLGLYALHAQEGGNTGMMMAGSLLMTLPVILLFFLAQRYFIQGITLSGMKG